MARLLVPRRTAAHFGQPNPTQPNRVIGPTTVRDCAAGHCTVACTWYCCLFPVRGTGLAPRDCGLDAFNATGMAMMQNSTVQLSSPRAGNSVLSVHRHCGHTIRTPYKGFAHLYLCAIALPRRRRRERVVKEASFLIIIVLSSFQQLRIGW